MYYIYDRFVSMYGRVPTETDPDYLELLRMSKYRILSVPDLPPGKCANCGASKNDNRKYVDFGLQVDWYGTVYLCGLCLKDISNEMGLFEELKESKANTEIIERLHDQGELLYTQFKDMFRELESYYDRVHSISNSSAFVDVGSSPDTVPNDSTTEPADKPGINSTEQRTTKPSSISGSSDVLSLTDLLGRSDE